jgi:hypothetical protein
MILVVGHHLVVGIRYVCRHPSLDNNAASFEIFDAYHSSLAMADDIWSNGGFNNKAQYLQIYGIVKS